MEMLGNLLIIVAYIGFIITGIWLLILQFQTSILWGLACLFIPFVGIIWLILNWEEGKTPFLYSLGAAAILIGGILMGGTIAT